MLFTHLLIALALYFWAVSQSMDLIDSYTGGIEFVQTLPLSVYGWIIVIGCLLVFLTVILEQLKSYGLMFLLSRIVLELSLLAVTLLSVGALFFCWGYLKNSWLDFIPVVLVPYLGIFVAMVMFRLCDFNYPYKRRVSFYVLFSWLSVVVVFVHLL